jgi:hypothetical protein
MLEKVGLAGLVVDCNGAAMRTITLNDFEFNQE